jgi:hypothetical protein
MKIRLSYAAIALGLILGIFGVVRTGSILIAIGTAGVATINFLKQDLKAGKRRKIEFVLPLAVALLLFVVALTLPHAK